MSIRDKIKAAQTIKPVRVDIETIGPMYIQPLTAGAAIEIQREIQEAKDAGAWSERARKFDAELMTMMLVEENGGPLYKRDELADLLAMPLITFRLISEAVMNVSGLTAASQEAVAKK